MTRQPTIWLCLTVVLAIASTPAMADEAVTRTEDVIYARKFGTALTLDVFSPKQAEGKPGNGAAVIFVVSGGWYSSHE